MKKFKLILINTALLLNKYSKKKSKKSNTSKAPTQQHNPTSTTSTKPTSPTTTTITSPNPTNSQPTKTTKPKTTTTPIKTRTKHPHIKFTTNIKKIIIKLNPNKTPKSITNFLTYIKTKHYNNTIFHQIITNFMIQNNNFTTNIQQKPTRTPIQNKTNNGLKNTKNTLTITQTNVPHSTTNQFFINIINNTFLNHHNKTPHK